MTIRIRTPDDRSHSKYGRVLYFIGVNQAIKCAMIAVMSKPYIRNVVRNCAQFFGALNYFQKWDIDEFRLRVNKMPDQPWAGNAVNFWLFASDPFHKCKVH